MNSHIVVTEVKSSYGDENCNLRFEWSAGVQNQRVVFIVFKKRGTKKKIEDIILFVEGKWRLTHFLDQSLVVI